MKIIKLSQLQISLLQPLVDTKNNADKNLENAVLLMVGENIGGFRITNEGELIIHELSKEKETIEGK